MRVLVVSGPVSGILKVLPRTGQPVSDVRRRRSQPLATLAEHMLESTLTL